MASMKEIREHIASIQSTQKVTNAMYLIASTKMRRAKEDLAKTRPFFDASQGGSWTTPPAAARPAGIYMRWWIASAASRAPA